MTDLLKRVAAFSTDSTPQKECTHEHQFQGTGAVFYQSVGLLQCSHCRGWQLIRKPVK